MDSPVFGSSKKIIKTYKPTTNFIDDSSEFKQAQYILALLTLQKNIKKFVALFNFVMSRRKREVFTVLKYREFGGQYHSGHTNNRELQVIIDAERKIGAMFSVVRLGVIRTQLSAWRALMTHCSLQKNVGQQKRVRTFQGQRDQQNIHSHRRKKKSQLKQNSAENVSDIPTENKRLKQEIQREQMDEESFIAKMKSILDTHEKQLNKGKSKKKK